MAKERNWNDRTEHTLSEGQRRHLQPLGPVARALAPAVYAVVWLAMRGLFRLEVRGRERLPDPPSVLAPNHASYLDPFVIAIALGYPRLRETYWGAWVGVILRNRLTRFIARLGQAVPIDPWARRFSSLALGAAVLRRRKNLVWFAEGRRSQTGELQPLRPGVASLLASFEVPVTPVYVHGTHAAMPAGCRFPRLFRRITVVFGEPLPASDLARRGAGPDARSRILDALATELATLARTGPERAAAPSHARSRPAPASRPFADSS